jgi:hypothetical protein
VTKKTPMPFERISRMVRWMASRNACPGDLVDIDGAATGHLALPENRARSTRCVVERASRPNANRRRLEHELVLAAPTGIGPAQRRG